MTYSSTKKLTMTLLRLLMNVSKNTFPVYNSTIDDETAKYLKENSPKPGRFYNIPKIHKQGHPGRPIVSSN